MNASSSNSDKDYYLRPLFWSQPENQFWNRSNPPCTEAYTNYEEPIMAKWVEGKTGMMFWDYDEFNDQDITSYVTHWLVLPELPIS